MGYFDENFLKFFKGLKKNNNKEWFDKNKSTYENAVKKPFEKLVADLILKMQKLHPGFQCEVKEAVFRINRDIRFSKDKTPYKTSVTAVICHGGRKNLSNPGVYIELSQGHLGIFGGAYEPDKDQLSRIRTAIMAHPKEVKKLNSDKKFIETFGQIKGDKNKVLPPEFKAAAVQEPLVANKQFYFSAIYQDDQLLLSDDLVPFIIKHYTIGLPWSNFLSKAIQGA